jgi:hypothetical protein
LAPEANLWGNSFACARVTLDIALKMESVSTMNHETGEVLNIGM